jgi:hypothetical protein
MQYLMNYELRAYKPATFYTERNPHLKGDIQTYVRIS